MILYITEIRCMKRKVQIGEIRMQSSPYICTFIKNIFMCAPFSHAH